MTRPDDAAIRAAHRAGWEAAMNTLNPSQRSPYPGMPPLRDGIRAPLPEGVRTAEDLAAAMNDLRVWAGAPSLQELSMRVLLHFHGLPESMLRDALNGSMAKLDMLHAYVYACGAIDDWPAWYAAWRCARLHHDRTQGETA